MKSLVFSHTATWPIHHAESIEISLSERKLGNEVVFLSCTGSLKTCPAFAIPTKKNCKVCCAQTSYTKSKVLPIEIELMDLDIQKYHYSYQEFNSIDGLKSFELHKVPFGNMVYSTITSELNDSFFDVIKHKDKINKLLENAIGLYQYGIKIIKKNSIDQVYVWNGRRSCDGPLVYAAKHSGIKYSTFISGGSYNSLLVRHNSLSVHDLPAAKNELLEVVNKIKNNIDKFSITKSALNYFNFSSGNPSIDNINHVGFYQFSKHFNKTDKSAISVQKGKRVIAVFTGTYSEFAGVPGYDNPDNFCNNFYEGVSFIQENLHRIPNAELHIRWHPNSRNLKGNERDKLVNIVERGRQIDNVYHISPESNFNTYDLIHAADNCIGFGTSVSIEACLYGKPTIFIGNNIFEDLDCFYRPNSYDELIEILNTNLKVKDFDHALAWGYYFSNFGSQIYKHLNQQQEKTFYYKGRRVANLRFSIRTILGRIKRSLLNLSS